MPVLSVVVPVYNESDSIEPLLKRVLAVPVDKEVIVVDDGSMHETKQVLERLGRTLPIRVITHPRNQGKGAAVKTGFQAAVGDIVLIQDADLEYNPRDIARLIACMEEDPTAMAVYGSRNLEGARRGYARYYLGGKLITFLTNLLCGARLTDITTGYKLFRRIVFEAVQLERDDFAFCEEVTVKMIRRGFRIREVPIHYYPRTFREGKKIRPRDGMIGLLMIIRYRFFSR
jgi:glycosyltransferase involved in cell wall biosynthesis